MKIKIRQERAEDHKLVFSVIQKAFEKEEISDHQEHYLVERLRESEAFIPELSLVAEKEDQIVGHIILSKIKIVSNNETFQSLALAPVSVHPNHQGEGIGSSLIEQAHLTASRMGFQSVALLGHPEYYPRFGYEMAHLHGVSFPFDAPKEACMIKELKPGTLKKINGMISYPPAFFQ